MCGVVGCILVLYGVITVGWLEQTVFAFDVVGSRGSAVPIRGGHTLARGCVLAHASAEATEEGSSSGTTSAMPVAGAGASAGGGVWNVARAEVSACLEPRRRRSADATPSESGEESLISLCDAACGLGGECNVWLYY